MPAGVDPFEPEYDFSAGMVSPVKSLLVHALTRIKHEPWAIGDARET